MKLSKVYLLNIGYWKLYRQLSKETGTPIASLPHVDGCAVVILPLPNFWHFFIDVTNDAIESMDHAPKKQHH